MAWNNRMAAFLTNMIRGGKDEQRFISFQDFWGQGRDVTLPVGIGMDSALTLASVYSATSFIADMACQLPLQSFKKQGDIFTKMDPQNRLLASPSEFGTVNDWVHRAVISMALRGNAFGLITQFDTFGYPLRIEWLHPDEVTLRIDRTVAPPQWYWLGRPVDRDLMVHIPYYTVPGRILGVAPIKAYAMSIETGLLAQNFGRDWFKHGSVPAGLIKTDKKVAEDDAEVIKQRFKRAASARETVVLGMGTEYQPISVSPEESQFLETMRWNATQVAAIYHLPPSVIGGDNGDSMTYTNNESLTTNIVRFALNPYLTRIESALFSYMPRPQYARFETDAFERADMLTRYNAYHIALTDGWKTRDEVRRIEDLEPLPDGKGGISSVAPLVGPTGQQGTKAPGGATVKTGPLPPMKPGHETPVPTNGKVVAS